MPVPITQTPGVHLEPTMTSGISRACVDDSSKRMDLSWDRYVRLKAAADAVEQNSSSSQNLLDAGGYDGALALFLPDYQVDVIDPATTGGTVLSIPVPDQSYPITTAIDVLEHIPPPDRLKALAEFSRVTQNLLILNYPTPVSKPAQELALQLTQNSLLKDHVDWTLPDSAEVTTQLSSLGFTSILIPHTSIAIWLPQYVTLNLVPEKSIPLNQHLITHHPTEPFTDPLYHLLICTRTK